ncbi:F0F1 ATP synthase subunit A [Staphylospora marina]|uniref:F0F1 ATP synthase subunit A n=1 Tax=Staphylospora marina TaxID=2490858 RepID=UPI000F5BF3AC|nr:F0F1 ATP synthase subunit A [Staphylospora marina]
MEKTPKLSFEVAGFPVVFDVTVMITTTVTCVLVFLLAWFASRKLRKVPRGIQNVVEMIIEFVQGIVKTNIQGKTAERFYGFAFTLFLFIFIANQLGLIFNVITEPHEPIPFLGIEPAHGDEHHAYAWWKSPTADINVTISMAFAITIVAHFLGFRKSPKSYIKHYFQPFAVMFPLHVIDEVAKPVTHGMRLWANIFAGEILIAVMLMGKNLFLGAPLIVWLGYSIFVGTIQAYVFTVLAMVYMSQKLASDH